MTFLHPAASDITLEGIFGALSHPTRLNIVLFMLKKGSQCSSCSEVAPGGDIAKSTLSNHFRILREAGLVRSEKRGVEHRNILRKEEIDARFPGLLKLIETLAA
jgi:DNA-binding transcriptional ArsR family regulator